MRRKKIVPIVPAVPAMTPAPSTYSEPILTPSELAAAIKVPESSIYEMTRNRKNGRRPMPKLKAGRELRFKLSAVVQWMEENGRRRAA